MNITMVYALPERQVIRELVLDGGADIEAALQASGWLQEFPEIRGQNLKVGIFGQLAHPATLLKNGDRVEIYRPLKLEPKEARRKRGSQPSKG